MLGTLQRQILVRRGVGKARHQAKAGLANPRSDTIDEGELPDRRVDHALGKDLLDFIQQPGAFRVTELGRLLPEQQIDVRVIAVDKGSTLDGEGFEPCGGIAEGAAAALDDVLVGLFGVTLDKAGALDQPAI
jgi:hypothetical protein